MTRAMADAASLNGDWIEWSGGECPVDAETEVEVRVDIGRGKQHLSGPDEAGWYDRLDWWAGNSRGNSIVAYRLAVQS